MDGGNPVKHGGASSSIVQHCEHLTSWYIFYDVEITGEVLVCAWVQKCNNAISMKSYHASGFITRFRITVNQRSSCRALTL